MSILYGRPIHSEEYQRCIICREFGWDYYTYEKQPARFIEELLVIMNQESQKEKSDMERAKKRSSIPKSIRR